jgi:hypothetical protein
MGDFERYVSANKPTLDTLFDLYTRQLDVRRRALIMELREIEAEMVMLGKLNRPTFPIDKPRTSMLK